MLTYDHQIAGIIPLGTSMDYESDRTRALGCWDGPAALTEAIEGWSTSTSTPEFKPGEDYGNFLVDSGMGQNTPKETRDFWIQTINSNYTGDDGRRRIRMAAINLRDRDGLHGRVGDVTCPMLWMHGTADQVYSVKNAEEEIKMFTGTKDTKLQVVEGGQHFLSFSHPEVVDRVRFSWV
jgi:pimeloyl-ACP methyl ester carboxylesterase